MGKRRSLKKNSGKRCQRLVTGNCITMTTHGLTPKIKTWRISNNLLQTIDGCCIFASFSFHDVLHYSMYGYNHAKTKLECNFVGFLTMKVDFGMYSVLRLRSVLLQTRFKRVPWKRKMNDDIEPVRNYRPDGVSIRFDRRC